MSGPGQRARDRWVALAPFVVAIAVAGLASPVGAALAGVAVIVLALIPLRFAVDTLGQLALSLLALIAGVLTATSFLPKPPGPPGWLGLALGAILASALRLVVANPIGGVKVTQAFLLASVVACGGYRTSGYAVGVLTFLGVELLVLWALERGRPAWAELGRREWAGAVLGGLTALVTALGLVSALPPLHDRTLNYVTGLLSFEVSGFNSWIQLGELRGMIQSSRKVLRVFGKSPQHLRGVVYSRYDEGRWSAGALPLEQIELIGERGPEVTEVEALINFDSFFVPLEAAAIGTPGGQGRRDPLGVLRPLALENGRTRVWFRVTDTASADRPAIAPPGPGDLQVPARIAAELAAIARSWTTAGAPPEDLIRDLSAHLATYRYSLAYERTPGRDPVLDFLTVHQEGHCEYFASAMALLLRTLGVPARVAGGFLVTEAAPFGGYHVVRERNAHAWVEAFVEQRGWITVDPTPASGLFEQMSDRLGWAEGLVDGLSVLWGRTVEWIRGRSPAELAGGILALVGVWAGYRALRRRKAAQPPLRPSVEPALPCLERLLATLAKEGLARQESEPLERFAARVRVVALEGEAAARLLERYAALRYGRAGDEATLARAIEAWCRSVRLSAPRSGAETDMARPTPRK